MTSLSHGTDLSVETARGDPSLVQEANRELSVKLRKGLLAYLLLLAVMGLATDAFRLHPVLMWAAAGSSSPESCCGVPWSRKMEFFGKRIRGVGAL